MVKKISLDGIYQCLTRNGEPHFGIGRTSGAIEGYSLDLNPDFQRGVVWTQEQQENFVGHMLEGGDSSAVIVNMGLNKNQNLPRDEEEKNPVVDGLQRITACLRWERGEIGGRISDGRLIQIKDLDAVSIRSVHMQIGLKYALVHMTRKEMLEYYVKINRGGTVHSQEEIERVKKLAAKE